MKIIVVSGGFDPIHSGHIEYFKSAKDSGDKLLVALNSDKWLENKKGKFFMPFKERKAIIESIKYVNDVIEFEDDKKGTCINALEKVKSLYPNDQIYFANGGDRNKENIPEMSVLNVNFIFNVGGDDKKNSSSGILNKWKYYLEERKWGSFFNLFETENIKVKELIIEPCKAMSFQRHFKRNEIWLVSEGSCEVHSATKDPEKKLKKITLKKFDHHLVPVEHWHQICNPFNEACHIIEIQYGEECKEKDIERYFKNNTD
jgi:cytidyltransferase-like protein